MNALKPKHLQTTRVASELSKSRRLYWVVQSCLLMLATSLFAQATRDYGDYNGFGEASNPVNSILWIGGSSAGPVADAEAANPANGTATGDDAVGDDETIVGPAFDAGSPRDVSIYIGGTASSWLNARTRGYMWVDWNGNGTIETTNNERSALISVTSTGQRFVSMPSSASATPGTYYMRIRVQEDIAPTLTNTTALTNRGEVEDIPVTVNCPTLTISPTTLPNAVSKETYRASLSVSGAGYAQTMYWEVIAGVLPDGLSLDPSSGEIYGDVAVDTGTFPFTVGATDQYGCNQRADLSITIGATSLLSIGSMVFHDENNDGRRDVNEIGIPGVTLELWDIGPDGKVFTGDDVAVTSGSASDIDTASGSRVAGANGFIKSGFSTLTATTDWYGQYQFTEINPGTYYLKVIGKDRDAFASNFAGSSYSLNLDYPLASSVWYSDDDGVDDDNNGAQTSSGFAGAFDMVAGVRGDAIYTMPFTLLAGTEPGPSGGADDEYSIDIGLRPCPVITFPGITVPSATSGVAYSYTFTASGGVAAYTYSLISGAFPAGLTLSGDTLSGTTSSLGTYTFTIKATDALGCEGIATMTMSVCASAITITSGSPLPPGTQGVIYSTTLNASGGTAPYNNWRVYSGLLPSGLTINASTGVISGTPSVNGTFNFGIAVDDTGSLGSAVALNNASFESQAWNGIPFVPQSSVTGWTFGNPTLAGTSTNSQFFGIHNNVTQYGNTSQGVQYVASPFVPSWLSQTVTGFTVGRPYNLRFRYALRDAFSDPPPPSPPPPFTGDPVSVAGYNSSGLAPVFSTIRYTTPPPVAQNFDTWTTLDVPFVPAQSGMVFSFDMEGGAVDAIEITPAGSPACTGMKFFTLTIAPPASTTDFGDVTGTGFTPIPSTNILANLQLGTVAPDSEASQAGNATANLDDNTGDDEDGIVTVNLVQSIAGSVTLSVLNNTGSAKYLYGWVDLNGNGALDAGEAATNNGLSVSTSASQQNINLNFPAPTANGSIKSRFRISSSNAATALSSGDQGEIEDHLVTIAIAPPSLDFGDVTGTNFEPIPSTTITTNLRLGTVGPDGESSQVGNATANLDDTTGTDDEDGFVSTTLVQGAAGIVTISVLNNTGATCYVYGWLDLNGNGNLGAAEFSSNNPVPVSSMAGQQNIALSFSAPSASGALKARFRISTVNTATALSTGDGGEIEDHLVTVSGTSTDFGDHYYNASSSASQLVSADIRMGANLVDVESSDPSNANANMDDLTGTDDEKATLPTFPVGSATSVPITVTVNPAGLSGGTARIAAWADWNGDGDVLDANEAITPQTVNATGVYTFSMTPPVGTSLGTKYMRLRITEGTTAPLFNGSQSLKGEVEDHAIQVTPCADFLNLAWDASNPNDLAANPAVTNIQPWTNNSEITAGGYMPNADFSSGSAQLNVPFGQTGFRWGVKGDFTLTGTSQYEVSRMSLDYRVLGHQTEAKLRLRIGSWTLNVPLPSTKTGTGQVLPSPIVDGELGTGSVSLDFATDTLRVTRAGYADYTATMTQNLFIMPGTNTVRLLGDIWELNGFFYPDAGSNGVGNPDSYYSIDNFQMCAAPLSLASDFGDHTGFASASQLATPDLFMGSTFTDAEASNPTTGSANTDDTTGADDDDVSMPTFTVGSATNLVIPVVLPSAAVLSNSTARINVFADWNGDGDVADPGETQTAQPVTATGSITFSLTPPAGTSAGTKYLRIRVTEGSTAPAFSGTSTLKGEVEDYAVTVNAGASTLDFGDVTGTGFTPIPSTTITANLRLGSVAPDGEASQSGDATANLDDTTGTDDEDGVLSTTLVQGSSGNVVLRVLNNTGVNRFLYGWVDLNGNGNLDAGEAAQTNPVTVASSAAEQDISLSFGTATAFGPVKARFRVSTINSATAVSTGDGGEIEDHLISIGCATLTVSPASLPNGTQFDFYSQTLSTSGGSGTYSYSLQSGALPSGLTLSTAGLLSGTISSANGSYPFVVRVSDTSTGCRFDKNYTLVVGASGFKIGNLIFYDRDKDGIRGPKDPGIPNIDIELWTPGPDGFVNTQDDVPVSSGKASTLNSGGLIMAGSFGGD
ncbi:MAG: putative Ig domain-containing protein [Verrucomicrobiaceae bacterium]|nr:putative Ig domain-containing protein [Verrucomicrobiaceae bacterium]